jgi:hypothetical protein
MQTIVMTQGSSTRAPIPPLAIAAAGGIAAAFAVFLGWLLATHHWVVDASGHPLVTDFLSFWSAGQLALEGHAAAAYDWSAMHSLQHRLIGRDPAGFLGWAYPPMFFCAAILLALLPYAMSFLTWTAATLALHAATLARAARGNGAALIACATPAALACAMVGQNGFLSAALIAGVLLQLETRPLLAGVLLGLLTYKPHLGLLFPIALVFGGHWRAFFSATVTTVLILFLSFALAADSLAAFAGHIGNMSQNFLTLGAAGFYKHQSLYGLLRTLGVGDQPAFVAQGVLLSAMAGFVAWLWRSGRPLALKSAGLIAASLLATPYLYFYDLPILSVAIAFLWRDHPFGRAEAALLLGAQLVMATIIVLDAPTGLAGSVLVLIAVLGRLRSGVFTAAPQPRPA